MVGPKSVKEHFPFITLFEWAQIFDGATLIAAYVGLIQASLFCEIYFYHIEEQGWPAIGPLNRATWDA